MDESKRYTAVVDYDPVTDQYVIPLPVEMCAELGWSTGTELEWELHEDGIMLKKKKQPKYQLVEAISTFRMRYVVEVDDPVWAEDTVTMNEAKEFSQEHLGETIVSTRELTRDEVVTLCDVDNHYCKSWTEDQKIENFVTTAKDLK